MKAGSAEARVRVGPAGWSYRDWEGIVYPEGAGKDFSRLAYLAAYFDVVEVNVTFYRFLLPRYSQRWLEEVGGNGRFRFTVKLLKRFTHDRRGLGGAEESRWKKGIAPLAEAGRLGAVLAQFPYSFHNTTANRGYLVDLRRQFGEFPLVVEVRHRSWDRKEVFDFLRENDFGFCNIDQPRVSYSIFPTDRVTSPIGYVRLHGRNVRDWFRKGAGRDARYNYSYSGTEIAEWLEKINQVSRQARQVYVIANNHFRGQAPANALEIKSGLEGKRVLVPPPLLRAYPRLGGIRSRGKR